MASSPIHGQSGCARASRRTIWLKKLVQVSVGCRPSLRGPPLEAYVYQPPLFNETRPEVLHALIRAHPLGLLISSSPEGPVANPVPMLLDADIGPHGRLRAHVARANPHWREKSRSRMTSLHKTMEIVILVINRCRSYGHSETEARCVQPVNAT